MIAGKRQLQGQWLEGFITAAQLATAEAEYLRLMSSLDQCDSSKERERLLSKILELVESRSIASLTTSQLQLLRKPLAWTLLYMTHLADHSSEPKWFKKRLRKSMSIPEIREALDLLENLGLIELTSEGLYQANAQRLKTSDQVERAQNYEFHKFVLNEGLSMLEELDPRERAYGSLTIAVPKNKIEEFKAEVSRFSKGLLVKYGNDNSVSGEIMRLNFQLYPLTQQRDDI